MKWKGWIECRYPVSNFYKTQHRKHWMKSRTIYGCNEQITMWQHRKTNQVQLLRYQGRIPLFKPHKNILQQFQPNATFTNIKSLLLGQPKTSKWIPTKNSRTVTEIQVSNYVEYEVHQSSQGNLSSLDSINM
ncbi:hypothetical protein PRUPE_5G118300 [Prunus persica]|uniref:Uncharacterized protein n=1 Tax=Prunus persica TaxID=3760 RepID=M5WFB7_PRUPE|nr:hypothetical protein PRUPE_5G118300 [Prunus persica]